MSLTASAVHMDVPLTNITVAHMQNMDNFVATKIFPTVGVEKQSDKYYVFDRDAFNRDEMKELAAGAEPESVEFTLSDDSYFCTVYGNSFNMTDQMLANEDKQLRVRSNGAKLLANKGIIKREKEFLNKYFKAGVWNTQRAGVASAPSGAQIIYWDNYDTSTPIEDVSAILLEMQLRSGGFRPNKMLMTRDVWNVLKDHPDILARISGGATTGSPAKVTKELVASLFEIDEILVQDGIENVAKEGAPEDNQFMATRKVAFYYAAPEAGLETASAGYNFTWSSLENVSDLGVNILSFTGEDLVRKGVKEQLQIRMSWDMKVVSADLGGFIDNAISAP